MTRLREGLGRLESALFIVFSKSLSLVFQSCDQPHDAHSLVFTFILVLGIVLMECISGGGRFCATLICFWKRSFGSKVLFFPYFCWQVVFWCKGTLTSVLHLDFADSFLIIIALIIQFLYLKEKYSILTGLFLTRTLPTTLSLPFSCINEEVTIESLPYVLWYCKSTGSINVLDLNSYKLHKIRLH